MQHHKALGTDQDPERLLLYAGQDSDYRPLCSFGTRRCRCRGAGGGLILQFGLFWAAFAAFAWVEPTLSLRVAVLWLVPFATLTQGIQEVRLFAEHAALNPGLLGRLVVWPYNIQYHREHHERPSVPWYDLPRVFPDRVARPGSTLPALLWNGEL
jgi:hypothetical protein